MTRHPGVREFAVITTLLALTACGTSASDAQATGEAAAPATETAEEESPDGTEPSWRTDGQEVTAPSGVQFAVPDDWSDALAEMDGNDSDNGDDSADGTGESGAGGADADEGDENADSDDTDSDGDILIESAPEADADPFEARFLLEEEGFLLGEVGVINIGDGPAEPADAVEEYLTFLRDSSPEVDLAVDNGPADTDVTGSGLAVRAEYTYPLDVPDGEVSDAHGLLAGFTVAQGEDIVLFVVSGTEEHVSANLREEILDTVEVGQNTR